MSQEEWMLQIVERLHEKYPETPTDWLVFFAQLCWHDHREAEGDPAVIPDWVWEIAERRYGKAVEA